MGAGYDRFGRSSPLGCLSRACGVGVPQRFFMLSEYNLRNQEDGRFLEFSELPEWVKTNTMYYFNPSGEDLAKGSVKVRQVKEIIMEVNQNPYKMIVKVGQEDGSEREYHLGSRYMIEIKKWENAINVIQGRFNE